MAPDAQFSHSDRPPLGLIVFLVVPLLGILAALIMILAEGGPVSQDTLPVNLEAESASLINYPAPAFELQDMAGQPINFSDYQDQILFLNFWQTTCAPCVRELPAFAEFAADQAGQGVAVLAVNFDETTTQVQRFFDENDIRGVPLALDPASQVRRTYGVQMLPTTFVIDRDGRVRFMHLGELTYDEMLEYAELARTTDPSVNQGA